VEGAVTHGSSQIRLWYENLLPFLAGDHTNPDIAAHRSFDVIIADITDITDLKPGRMCDIPGLRSGGVASRLS
jgi:hypothetical protein